MRTHRTLFALCVSIALALSTLSLLSVQAAPGPPTPAGLIAGPLGGVIPARSITAPGLATRHLGPIGAASFGGITGAQNLTYHGGPIVVQPHIYVINWSPSNYPSDNRWQNNTSNGTDAMWAQPREWQTADINAWGSDNSLIQYCAGQTCPSIHVDGPTFTPSVVSDAAPNDCSNPGFADCVTQSDINAEIEQVRVARGWPAGVSSEIVLFLGSQQGTCAGSNCFAYPRTSGFCAYHSYYTAGGVSTPYIVLPPGYLASQTGAGLACYSSTQGFPSSADVCPGSPPCKWEGNIYINNYMHEQSEVRTDPLLNAWYYSCSSSCPNGLTPGVQYENGDNCNYVFGPPLGTWYGQAYNMHIGQTLNGTYYNPYEVQGEWSNQANSGHGACVTVGLSG